MSPFRLSASIKFLIVGLVQLTILLKPLCHPSARLEDLESPQMLGSHWFHPRLSKRGSAFGMGVEGDVEAVDEDEDEAVEKGAGSRRGGRGKEASSLR